MSGQAEHIAWIGKVTRQMGCIFQVSNHKHQHMRLRVGASFELYIFYGGVRRNSMLACFHGAMCLPIHTNTQLVEHTGIVLLCNSARLRDDRHRVAHCS